MVENQWFHLWIIAGRKVTKLVALSVGDDAVDFNGAFVHFLGVHLSGRDHVCTNNQQPLGGGCRGTAGVRI